MSIDSKLKNIKGILFDVDGTFVNQKNEIPAKTRKIIPRLLANHFQLGVCTGRSYSEIRRFILPVFPADSLHITDDGGKLVTGRGEIVEEILLPSDLVKKICARAEELGVDYGFGHQGVKYFNQPFLAKIQAKDKWQKSLANLANLEDWSTPCLGIYNLNSKMKQFLDSLDTDQLELTESKSAHHHSTYIKLANRGVNKGSALKKWAAYYQLKPSQVMMLGDSHNDITAMKTAGVAVAVGNGVEELKKVSDLVIGSVEQDGVAKFLHKFLSRMS